MVAVAEHIKVPELRFPEFSGEWERKRLGELLEFFPTNSLSRKQLDMAGTGPHIIHYGDIHTKYPAILSGSNPQIPRAIHDDVKGTPCKDGDLLIADASEDYGDIGKAIEVVNTNNRMIFGGLHVIHARAVEGAFTITFLTRLFQSKFVRRQIQRRANGATVLGISYKQVQLIQPLIPSLPEQQKIAEFLTAVDEKIGKLKRKKELLEAYKKGAMQKLFSQEIRFKDDQGNPYPDWEEKRLGEVFRRVNTKNKTHNDNVMTISGQHGLINQVEYFNKSVSSKDTSHYTILKRGQFAYNKSYSKGYPMGAIKRLSRYASGIVSPLYICFELSSNGNDRFFEHFFETGLLNKWIQRIAQEGARNHGLLNVSIPEFFSDLPIPTPSLPEQQKIAEFLTGIDNKIAAVANQIDKAAEFKKGLLQKMFV